MPTSRLCSHSASSSYFSLLQLGSTQAHAGLQAKQTQKAKTFKNSKTALKAHRLKVVNRAKSFAKIRKLRMHNATPQARTKLLKSEMKASAEGATLRSLVKAINGTKKNVIVHRGIREVRSKAIMILRTDVYSHSRGQGGSFKDGLTRLEKSNSGIAIDHTGLFFLHDKQKLPLTQELMASIDIPIKQLMSKVVQVEAAISAGGKIPIERVAQQGLMGFGALKPHHFSQNTIRPELQPPTNADYSPANTN